MIGADACLSAEWKLLTATKTIAERIGFVRLQLGQINDVPRLKAAALEELHNVSVSEALQVNKDLVFVRGAVAALQTKRKIMSANSMLNW